MDQADELITRAETAMAEKAEKREAAHQRKVDGRASEFLN